MPDAAHRYRSPTRFLLETAEGVLFMFGAVITWPISSRWLDNWGSTPDERHRVWSADRFAPVHARVRTRAIDVDAPAEAVWQWVVQFGYGRGGFHSYEALERLVGIPVKNLESIDPTLQGLAVGDQVLLHPKAPPIPVAEVEPGRRLCFGVDPAADTSPSPPARSWAFYVEPRVPGACRLLVRGCVEQRQAAPLAERMALAIEAPVDFVMEQRMLRTIKRLAESYTHRPRAAADAGVP